MLPITLFLFDPILEFNNLFFFIIFSYLILTSFLFCLHIFFFLFHSFLGSIPLGDKSSPEDIASYFHGISKKDFKNAIGSLYREGLVLPGGLVTSLVADENIRTNKITAEATKKATAPDPNGLKIPRIHSERDSSRSVFIGKVY